MEKGGGDNGGPSTNNSSDFVRKLYKMLEDPNYKHIVKWGDGGESFVVLENEKFTKLILPKHFKHSNFASFVRQLNKYDFHKVRQNNEDSTPSPYGPNAWEFKHPEFREDNKESLDNIRRKAPAPRKPAQSIEEQYPSAQIDLLNGQLMATQQQLQYVSDKYNDLAQGHAILLQQVVQLQKFVKNHDGVMHRVMGFLHSVDAQRRNSRVGGPFGNGAGGDPMSGDLADDHPASPLQQASQLLDEFSAENLPNKELEQMTHDYHLRHDYSTPPNGSGGSSTAPHPEASMPPHLGYPINNDLENLVYPVGHTNGIDPVARDHINNIPYSLPSLPTAGTFIPEPESPVLVPASSSASEKKNAVECVWGMNKPRILLVEDDKICARIGGKFLQAFECGVEIARDGLEAVNKMNQSPDSVDLILMDIIMPHLDGVSATVCIREIRPTIPVIAMTSNIRTDDIDMYFRYGMNDVLPKPFTKEGMLRALEKHLPQFKKNAPFPPAPISHPGNFVTPIATSQPLGLTMGGQLSATLKDEVSPGKSAGGPSWQSPISMSGSPSIGLPGNYMQQPMDNRQYAMSPVHPLSQPGFIPPQNASMVGQRPAHRRVMSDMTGGAQDDHPDKRQRMYPSQTGFS